MALVNDFCGIFLVLGLARESKLILGLAIRDFVNTAGEVGNSVGRGIGFNKRINFVPEPLVRGAHEARQMTFNILNVVQLGRERVLDVDDKDLPIGLAFVEEGHDAEDFDLLDLPNVTHLFADLAYVQWIVVAPGLGLGVLLSGILPSL
jgi:hypothetical protein